MAYRSKSSDDDSGDEQTTHDVDDESDGPSQAKKARNVWSDMLMDEQLLNAGKRVKIDGQTTNQRITRGPESYEMPADSFPRNPTTKEEFGDKTIKKAEKPIVMVTPACDDPFGDAVDLAPAENFGVKTSERRQPEEYKGWWTNRGHARRYGQKFEGRGRGGGDGGGVRPQGIKRPWQEKTADTKSLINTEYSLEALLATEFMEGTPVEELGNEMARAMGEKEPETVTKIVCTIGEEKAIALFNMTRDLEKNGGMKTADGSRRRTPGGVFITLFKTDPDVSSQTKDEIFGDVKLVGKQRAKLKRKMGGAGLYEQRLASTKASLEKAKEEELPVPNVADVLLKRSPMADGLPDYEEEMGEEEAANE